jgi:tRNA1(Val) A37 N6-methylase TrmN6
MRAEVEISEDAILGGRLRIRQPLRGHRVGHDAVLLAAAARAHAGQRAADLGAGVGAVGLALAVQSAGLRVTLIEIDAALCALAADNARLNGLDDRVTVVGADAGSVEALQAAGAAPASFDCVLMNPPFFDARRHNVSPDPRRRSAHVGSPGLLGRWVATSAWLMKPAGVLTLIWRADELNDVEAALRPAFGDISVLPVLPRAGAPAIRVLVSAVRDGGASKVTYRPLVLNDNEGRPTAAAEAVLRAAAPLEFLEKI